MSHFTCLAIGSVDQIMEKYDEQNEDFFQKQIEEETFTQKWYERTIKRETADDKKFYHEFMIDSDEDESLAAFLTFCEDNYCEDGDLKKMQEYDDEKTSYYIIKDNRIVSHVYFSNPDAKYDYYTEGGRWDGLLMKDGSTDCCGEIGDIDIEGMLDESRKSLAEDYDNVINAIGHVPSVTPWSDFLEKSKNNEMTIEEARELYHAQEDCKAFDEYGRGNGFNFYHSVEDFSCTKEEYIAQANLPIFCANINGEWYEKGQMGWWACVSDEKEENNWRDELIKAIMSEIERDPHQEFTFLDCHI